MEEKKKVLEDVGRTSEAKVIEDLIHYNLNEPSSDCFFLKGSHLTKQDRIELIEFLTTNIEVMDPIRDACD